MATLPSTLINVSMQTNTYQGGKSKVAIFIATGNQTTFVLPSSDRFILGSTIVFVNKAYQGFKLTYNETADCTSIIFNSAVTNGNTVEIRYIQTMIPYVAPVYIPSSMEVQLTYNRYTSTSSTVFTLPAGVFFVAGSTVLFINGLYQNWGLDYTENANRQGITTTTVTPAGWIVELRYVASSN